MNSLIDAFAKPVLHALPKLPGALIAFLIGYVALRIISRVLKGGLKFVRTTKAVRQILVSITNVILWAILLALVFQSLGLPQVALALSGSVAIFGILLASGANFLVSDILSGLFLARDPDFKIGERIKFNEVEGVIEYIDLRKIRLKDDKNCIHVIPNSLLDKGIFVVLDGKKK